MLPGVESFSWTTTRSRRIQHTSFLPLASSSSSSLEENGDETERMELVRQLQKTFYQSSPSTDDTNNNEEPRPRLETTTGRVLNLPLWRVGWVEVPGRANCLNVHEGHYTNMFEKILAGPQETWYFGHLHLPGGTTAARTREARFDLKTWREEMQDEKRFDETERSAVVGSLMRISDFRRLQDGRLVLLVHALERFVVDQVIQTFPYGMAHVQILPDLEDVLSNISNNSSNVYEDFGKEARAAAVRYSFQYHEYECDPIPLPLPKDTEYMASSDVFGSEIAKCLPFAFYAKDDSSLHQIQPELAVVLEEMNPHETETLPQKGPEALLEYRLQNDLILRNPPPLPGITSRTAQDINALETFVWLALEDFCRNTGFVLPLEILCLMPPHMDTYLDLEPPAVRISSQYPDIRRQRRLSYALPALIENTRLGAPFPMRQILLNTPTTQARLAAVLDRFEALNNALLGEFQ